MSTDAGSATGIDLAKMSRDEVIKIMIKRDMLSQHGYRTLLNGDFISLNLDHLTALANAALARATPQHSVTEQASIGRDPEFVRLLSKHAASRQLEADLLAYLAARAQPLASTAATQPEQASDPSQFTFKIMAKLDEYGMAVKDDNADWRSRVRGEIFNAVHDRAALAIPASTAASEQQSVANINIGGCPFCGKSGTCASDCAASEQQASVSELPPLPEPKYAADDLTDIFTADQMHEYARAALSSRATIPSEADERHALKVKVRGGRVWLVNHYQSFELGYVGDAEALEEYAGHLRAALTHRATTATHSATVKVLQAALAAVLDKDAATPDIATTAADQQGSAQAGEDARAEVARLTALLNTPETLDFIKGLQIEVAHQRERWASSHDAGKASADWFWLIGYLAQKAMMSQLAGDVDKALHHTITTAAALANWHAAILGQNDMRPGIAPPDVPTKDPK